MTAGLPVPCPQIADFGLSKKPANSLPKTRVGTISYMAPGRLGICQVAVMGRGLKGAQRNGKCVPLYTNVTMHASVMPLCCLPPDTRRAARALVQPPCATLLSPAEVLLAGPTQRYDGHKADIWSAGVVLYAMLFSRVPFEVHEGQDGQGNGGGVRDRAGTIQRILAGDWGVPHGINVSPQVLNLLGQILVPDPGKRASMDKVGSGG